MDKLIGKTINDRYIITEIIGVGGMAVVYKAFDKVVNRVVAVKVLKEEFMSDAQFRRRFTNESKAITMLSQNNIVDVYDVCLEGDMMYLVMEYIDGVTLKEYLDKVKVLDWHEAAFYIKQILKAMSHAHERGIVHRDIKPHNIMLLRDGTIKVTDFGIAKLSKFETQTITDKAIGSVHYISPEQASGDRTDEKTDIYAVGVMLYEMITGTLPFVADSAVSVALMQVQAQPKLPREINDSIPEGIEEITIKAMMKDPALRYSSASAMFNDIVSVEENPDTVFGYLSAAPVVSDEQLSEDDSPTRFVDISGIESADEIGEFVSDDAIDVNSEEAQSGDETESKFKEIWLPIIGGVGSALLIIAIVIVGIVYFPELKNSVFGGNSVVEKVTVENYVGQNYDEVEKSNATGLIFEKTNMLSTEPKGTIISQEPVAGEEVDKGSVVTFKVSIGVETVQVPDVTNKYYEIAIDELYDLGILYKTKYIASDTVKENYVVRTDPAAFTEIKSDTSITVYISSGRDIKTVTVPDVLKRTEDDAVAKLAAESLKADKLYEYDETVPKDCVISQNPNAGTKLDEGSTVEITISLGPKPEENPDKNPDDGNTDNPDQDPDKNPSDNPDKNPDETPDKNPDENTDVDVNNPDKNPDDVPTDNEPVNPDTDDKVSFKITADLSEFSAETSVTLTISTNDNSWNKVETITMANLAGANYVYNSESVTLKKGTVVSLFVNGTLFEKYTVS